MGKIEKIEKLQKLKESGSLTEEEFKIEKEKILNNEVKDIKISFNAVLVIIIIVTLIICIGGLIWYFGLQQKEIGQTENGSKLIAQEKNNDTNESMSFTGIKSNYKNYNNDQQEILKYFDNDYFSFYTSDLQKFPNVFKDAKVVTNVKVLKVLKSTDEEFEVLALNWGPNPAGIEVNISNDDWKYDSEFLIISGKQLSKRLTAGSVATIYGKYIDIVNRGVDGKDYVLPEIDTFNVVDISTENAERFNYDTIKTVSEYIFGKDIKISKSKNSVYKITLDNQSNSNFKTFNIDAINSSIEYDKNDNNLDNNIEKKLYVGADFQHYIVTTFDSKTKHIYIDYFDRDFKKMWSREFDYVSNKQTFSPMDYSSSKMAVVIDNELNLLDLKTGENIIEPQIVGEKIKVVMMNDGVVLIGDNNKDTFMKVSYEGKVIFKVNGNTSLNIWYAQTQIVNNKLRVLLEGYNDEDIPRGMKYVALNNDGTIESETEDIMY